MKETGWWSRGVRYVLFARPVGVGVVLDAGAKVWIVMRLDNGFR